MRLSPARFNRFLAGDVRQDVKWRKSYACPCTNPNSGSARQDCVLCKGKGHQWDAEVDAWAGMSNQTPQKGMAQFGVWEPGDATLTIPQDSPLYGVGQYDRVRCLVSTSRFSYNFIRGQGDSILGKVVSIDRVFWIAPDEVTIVEGGIPTVAADGSLSWASGAPPADTAYSISGVKFDEYFVYFPQAADRNSGVNGLPLKLLLRKFDLFGR